MKKLLLGNLCQKTRNLLIPFCQVAFLFLFTISVTHGQISIIESLDNGMPAGWTGSQFTAAEFGNAGGATACEGSEDLSDNLWSSSATGALETVSQTSNGDEITISFQWQTVEYNTGDGVGLSADVEYSTDGGSNWINIGNYSATAVTGCTTFSTTIAAGVVADGTSFVLRVTGNHTAGDFYHVVDDFSITQPVSNPPNCDVTLTSATTDFPVDGAVTWSAATGAPTGYKVSIGSTSGGTDIANNEDVGNSLSYNPTGLQYSTSYFVTITAYNAQGDASGCSEFTFLTESAPPTGSVCTDPIVINSLPFNTTDNTSTYGDDYSSADDPCSSSNYLGGDDVVYSYTPTVDENVDIVLTGTGSWTGVFVYSDCPFATCIGNATESGGNPSIEGITLTAGTTYYIVISTYPSPQSTDYTMNINVNSCTAPTVNQGTADFTNCPANTSVSFEVTDMGTATSITVTNDQSGANPGPITATGTYTVTGLPTTGEVIITLTDDDDNTCVVTLDAVGIECPPVEDNCSGAIDIPVASGACSGLTTGNNTGATNSNSDVPAPPAATCSSYSGGDIWFKLTVPASGNVNISGGPSPDCCSYLWYEVYEGNCASLTSVMCSATSGNDPSAFEMELTGRTAGETLYIRAWDSSNDNGPGDFNFCAYDPPACPAADNLVASDLTDSSASVAWTSTGTCNTDQYWILIAGSPAPTTGGVNAACNGGVSVTGLSAETEYDVWVNTVCTDGSTGPTNIGSFTTLAPPPSNDLCGNATPIAIGGSTSQDISSATDSDAPAVCSGGGGSTDNPASPCSGGTGTIDASPGVWYVITSTQPEEITVTLDGSDFDTELQVFEGTCGNLTCIAGDDDGGDGSNFESRVCWVSTASTDNFAPVNYYVYVDGHNGSTGTVQLAVNQAALPVKLDKFSAKQDGRMNKVEWTTVSEINVDHHTVMKSNDGINWTDMTQVDGQVNSTNTLEYSVMDQLPYPTTYYKLKMTDLDGSTDYSAIVSVTRDSEGLSSFLGASPVPTADKVSLNIFSQADDNIQITLMDLSGKVIQSFNRNIAEGNHQISVDLQDYQSGVYIVNLKSDYIQETTRVIKQ